MSVAAIMWTFDDRDILEMNVRYLLTQVDEVIVRHRQREPEALDILHSIQAETDQLVLEIDDGRFGWDQSRVMSDIAKLARHRGHGWVVPVDPDEVWYANDVRLGDFLSGLSRDTLIVGAQLFNHLVTPEDPGGHPFRSMGWRQTHPVPLPKVAVRTAPGLIIRAGNHSAQIGRFTTTIGPLLVVRHFPYRTEDQFIERVRTAYAELKVSRFPQSHGAHIRAYGKCLEEEGEEELRKHFRTWFVIEEPRAHDDMIYDPAPM